jgi:hypothetical protein
LRHRTPLLRQKSQILNAFRYAYAMVVHRVSSLPPWHAFCSLPEPDAVGKGQTKMTYNQTEVAVNARLLKVGLEVFPVYGDETSGFSVDPGDLYPQMPVWFRYQSLDELFFALVNLNLSPEGQA